MQPQNRARRIGLFVCHCGLNIAGVVSIPEVLATFRDHALVATSADYTYMCSEPGQQLLRETIASQGLDGVVVAACSPAMHEATFRRAANAAGLNPYRLEIANIREQVAWVHQHDPATATGKAIEAIGAMVEKVHHDAPLAPSFSPVTHRALVIGGGIAGMQAALAIADAGHPVILVEREDHLGGHVVRLSGTYFNFQAAGDLLTQSVLAVQQHPGITLRLTTEVADVAGYVGNFSVGMRRPGATESERIDVGAIVVATGFDLLPLDRLPEYGGGNLPDVISGLDFEQMLRPDGPTGGRLRRPSDGREPRQIVFVQCAGSRDPQRGLPYCSKICCLYTAKQARLFRQRCPDGQAYIFYIDIRSGGKGAEEFVQAGMEHDRILYLRGKVSRLFQEDDHVVVCGVDTLSGQTVEVAADLVVLATAAISRPDASELARRLHVDVDQHGFFNEAHPKLRPVESLSAGIYLAGAAQGPKDISESVSQASAAAAKVLALFSHRELAQEPTIAQVDETRCSGCELCVAACPYDARRLHAWKHVVVVNAPLCQGCGACAMVCPNKASTLRNATPAGILAMMEAVLGQ
jgi:heterodisulfide reductase subunit A-like polyferredoxin